ncbi:hypothetical protein, partial [Salmonella enterica]
HSVALLDSADTRALPRKLVILSAPCSGTGSGLIIFLSLRQSQDWRYCICGSIFVIFFMVM